MGTSNCQGGICSDKGWQVTMYTWKITDLLQVLSKKRESKLANVYVWKYLGILTTWHKRIDKGTVT